MQLVFIPNRKLFGQMKTELWSNKVGEFSVMLYGRMSWWAFFYPPSWLLLHLLLFVLHDYKIQNCSEKG